ncbi:MAG: 2,3-bisphosphoglycerate-independent phosphoglycerate mutase [Firmicutes bacterium]|nr:2,3-bisphosphoglycerate-independent phosphoglycerate mutase [Bacillota bacterium]
MAKKLNMLIIMDGFGYERNKKISAIEFAGTPNLKKLCEIYPHTKLGASGMDVGLPDGQMGNSEVGHLNIGAGRVVYQELTRITKSIEDGDFFENKAFIDAIYKAKDSGRKLHVMGLLSDGGVHSHNTHLYALIKMAKERGLNDIFIHIFLDGRDVSPLSGAGFIAELKNYCKKISFGTIVSVMGRYYAMDRDNRYERVQKAYDAMVNGIGNTTADAKEYVENSYKQKITDEFIVPAVVLQDGTPVKIEKGDSVIFFNFRPDRAREITKTLTQKDFKEFPVRELNLNYVCLTKYDETFTDVEIAYLPQSLNNTLGEYLAKKSFKQLRIAETEKYAHVTFFFNGGVEKPNKYEERILIPSPKVATYDLQPEMSAYEVTNKVIEEIKRDFFDVIILNFANCDMVGHTGIFAAAALAVNVVDECVNKIAGEVLKINGNLIITADHGNADKMLDDKNMPFTAHSTNPVPFIVVSEQFKNYKLKDGGILADIAPTLLEMMDLDVPKEMTGKSLLKGK